MKIKLINESVKALCIVDFHWLRIKKEKAKVIDIDSKTGKDDYNDYFKVFHDFILFYFFLI